MTTKNKNSIESHTRYLPVYKGRKWLDVELPTNSQPWLLGRQRSVVKERGQRSSAAGLLREVVKRGKWQWPKRKLYFFSDLHADADALIASLVASGGVKKTGSKQHALKLTSHGKDAIFVIGGDCFDKGPSNLKLLRSIRQLKQLGAKVVLLAGNHDLRVKLGIASVGMDPDPRHDHFFIRMGSKVIPMLREIVDEYLQDKDALKGVPPTRTCRRILYPPKRWFKEFPKMASWVMPDKRMARELKRLKEKIDDFESDCEAVGLSLRHV
ncbi:MAG: metallophosphoesterase, partial [Candidatus Thiodiazotropha endolucinida]